MFVIKIDSKRQSRLGKARKTEFLQTFKLKKAQNILSLTPSFESSRVRVLAIKLKLNLTQKYCKNVSICELF